MHVVEIHLTTQDDIAAFSSISRNSCLLHGMVKLQKNMIGVYNQVLNHKPHYSN